MREDRGRTASGVSDVLKNRQVMKQAFPLLFQRENVRPIDDHAAVRSGERFFVVLASGSLACSQPVLTLLGRDFDQGQGLAAAETFYDAERVVGDQIRRVAALDRQALEEDKLSFNVRGEPGETHVSGEVSQAARARAPRQDIPPSGPFRGYDS